MEIKAVHIVINDGRYNLLSSDESRRVQITVCTDDDNKSVGECWVIEDCPFGTADSPTPGETLDAIEERSKKYLIDTARERKAEAVAWMRENITEINRVWAASMIAGKQERMATLKDEIESLRDFAEQNGAA